MRAIKYLSAIALAASVVSVPAYAASSPTHAVATPAKASSNVKKGDEALRFSPFVIIIAIAILGGIILLATDSSKSP